MFIKLKRASAADSRLILNTEQIAAVRPRQNGCEIQLAMPDAKGKPVYYVVQEDFEQIADILID